MLQRPSYLANRTVALDDFIGGLGIAQPPRISLNGDRFTLLDETGMTLADATLAVDVVIVGVNKNSSRIYYDKSKPYDASAREAPLCWSDNGVGPSKACAAPQAPTCASCPNAVWGSAIGQAGKPIPACATAKKLAVIVSGHEGLFLLQVPPGSLGNFKQYISTLAKMPASPEELVTRVKMENKELLFESVDWVPETYMQFITDIITNDDAASIVNRHDEARDPGDFKALEAPKASFAPPPPLASPPQRLPAPQLPQAQAGDVPPPRRGRPPKVQPSPAPQPAFVAPNVQAPPQPAAPPTFAAPNVQAPPQGFGFGMQQQAPAPNADVQSMLARAFDLPRRT